MTYRLGVDLGTTFTAAATHRDNEVRIFPLSGDRTTLPSVLAVRDDGSVVVGSAAERRAMTEPERIAREFKRRIGDPTPILIGGQPYNPEWLIARLLEWVVQTVTEQEGEPPARVALTHPANWRSFKTDLLVEAVRLAGLDPTTTALLSEPEAAAMAYADSALVAEGEIIAVYDLGGGTFDAAMVRRTRTGFEIAGSPEGIERLGGIDFDAALFSHVTASLGAAWTGLDPDEPATRVAVARLRQDCTEAKEALSFDTDAVIRLELADHHSSVRVVRSEFEAMIGSSVSATIDAMRRAVRSAGVEPADVSRVLLIGGSSKVPLVVERVSAELERPVVVDAHPKNVVAIGAAYAAAGTHYRTAGSPSSVRANPGFDQPTSSLPAGQPAPATKRPSSTSPPPAAPPAATTLSPPPAGPPSPPASPGPAPRPDPAASNEDGEDGEDEPWRAAKQPAAAVSRRRRFLFVGIAAAVVVAVVAGGLLAQALRSGEDPIEMADETTLVAGEALDTLTVAVTAADAARSERWVLASILGEQLDSDVSVRVYRDPEAIAGAITNQEAALAILDPRSYVAATAAGTPIRPAGIAATGPGDTGAPRTFGLARAGNDQIDSLADAAGGVVCFADRTSDAGYLFPAAALADAGGDPDAGSHQVAGDHQASIGFVADGTCPIGFALERVVAELAGDGTISGVADPSGEGDGVNSERAVLEIVWKSAPITSDLLAVATWLPSDVQDQIIQATTTQLNVDAALRHGHCTDATSCEITESTSWGYAPATDADLDGWRLVCRLPDQPGCSL